jgi:hypothetical protein
MPKILDTRTSLDQTIRIFDSFYAFDLKVNAPDFDIIYGYFRSVCATQNIAGNFTAVFFRIAQETDIPALELLNAIKGTTNLQMNQVISYYLNSFKSKTSLYGIAVTPPPNQFVARNIVQ